MAVTYKMTLDDFNSYVSFDNKATAERWIAVDDKNALAVGWRCLDDEQTSRFYNRDWEHYSDDAIAQCKVLTDADVTAYEQATAALEGDELETYLNKYAETHTFADYNYEIAED